MAEESLHGGLVRPWHETIKVKFVLRWRHQHVGDVAVLGYLLRRDTDRKK